MKLLTNEQHKSHQNVKALYIYKEKNWTWKCWRTKNNQFGDHCQ